MNAALPLGACAIRKLTCIYIYMLDDHDQAMQCAISKEGNRSMPGLGGYVGTNHLISIHCLNM